MLLCWTGAGWRWRPTEPVWSSVAVATWQDLSKQICAAQGSGWVENTNECGEQRTPASPVTITVTSNIELEGRRLPKIFGKLRIQGACGGVGQR